MHIVTVRTPIAVLLAAAFTALGAFLANTGRSTGSWQCAQPPLIAPAVPPAHQGSGWDGPPRIKIGAQTASDGSNPLWEYLQQHEKGPIAHKFESYLDVYHRYFQRFRGRPLTFLEIGVQSGGTIGLWQSYFGDASLTYYGVDIDAYCRELFDQPPRVNIVIGDQADPAFWQEVAQLNPGGFDVILDDGGHKMQQQITTFESTWDMLKPGGVYICEDISTSMDVVYIDAHQWDAAEWGGGYGKNTTWFEHAKRLPDYVQGHYVSRELHPGFDPHNRTNSILSVAFYDQMVVLEKGAHPRTASVRKGSFMVPYGAGPVDPARLAQYKRELAASLAP